MRRWAIGAMMLALCMGSAQAQDGETFRFALQGDAEGGIWVLDGLTGDVARCRAGGEAAPRVIDLDFGVPVPRPRGVAGAEPICTGWRIIEAEASIRPRIVDAGFDPAGGTFSGQ